MRSSHSIRAALAALAVAVPLVLSAQLQPPVPAPLQEAGATSFTIFLRGAPIGTEQVALTRTATGWTIVSSGRLGAPIDVVARRLQVRYTPEWKPLEFTLRRDRAGTGADRPDRRRRHDGQERDLRRRPGDRRRADTIDPNALLLLPNSFFGPYEALAARLKTTAAGTELPVYLVPQMSITVRVGESSAEQIQTNGASGQRAPHAHRAGAARRAARRRPLDRRHRPDDPVQRAAAVARGRARGHRLGSSRSVSISRPNDEQVKIPGNGFLLAGTLSRPAQASATQLPAVVLVGGSGPTDRDEPGVRHPDPRPDRRRPRRRRLPRRPLRQARHRAERRPGRGGVAGRLRRGRARGHQDAGGPEGRRPEAHRRDRPQRRRAWSR